MPTWVPESLDNLVSTGEAATHCGVAVSTVRGWAHRGYIERSGLDDLGRPLYKLIDVLRCARDTSKRAGFGSQRIA